MVQAGSYVVALDLGTTSVKAVAVRTVDGAPFERSEHLLVTHRPSIGLAEQDADSILDAATAAVRAVVAAAGSGPSAVAISCAMHGVLPLDDAGTPLARLRTWADARGARIATQLRATDAWRSLQERTGTPVHASSPMCKIAELRDDESALFDRAACFVSAKELLLRRWFGSDVVDRSLATATGLCDLRSGDWDPEALAVAGLDRRRLSRIVPERHVLRDWRAGIAAGLGLDPGVPVVVGASDGCLANLGVAAASAGIVAVSLGTSGAARSMVEAPGVGADTGLFCYALDDGQWIVGGAVNDGGDAVAWLGDLLFASIPRNERVGRVLDAAASAPAGARGCRFVARLGGSRFPDYDSAPAGAFLGMSAAHGPADLSRAVVDGVVDGVGAIVDALVRHGIRVREVRAGGGMLRSDLVGHALAARLGVVVRVGSSIDASALGAARLALRAIGEPEPPEATAIRSFEP